ncbi:Aste57867_16296 [Aphanomyces stellatus]|uniref:Aste57867_16296 protein n=1 Tax=Aphanomyces stellatus TaxID=120398 RepID=A0A485L559_9STRA|nr:hypothetical protein As57867_016239 [Aphanomyces stellatus]VFT93072.1 Aste57867_16296 [Aphanomyces stellatus]
MEELNVEMLEQLDKRLKKRAYIRTFMKTYRKKGKRDFDLLKAQKVQLEAEVRALVGRSTDDSKSLLPWREVAAALAAHKMDAVDTNYALRTKVGAYNDLVQGMHAWVTATSGCNLAILRPLSATQPNWRNMHLPRHPQSRSLAKEWITQQLLTQADEKFHAAAFPAAHELAHDWDLLFTDDYFYVRQATQFVWDVPLHAVVSLYRDHLCSALWLDGRPSLNLKTVKETTEHTILHQMLSKSGEFVNLLCGVQASRGHTRIVLQQIQDDEAVDHNHRQRNRTAWLDIQALGPSKTKMRVFTTVSQNFTKDGYLDLDQEADRFGVDVTPFQDDELKRLKMREILLTRSQQGVSGACDHLAKVLQTLAVADGREPE